MMGKLSVFYSYLLSIFKLDRSILIYVFSWSTIGLVHMGIISVLGNLYVLKLGFDFSFLGVLNGSTQIIWALFAFPAGMIGKRFGLRNSVAAAFFVVVLGLASFLSAAWFPRPLWAPLLFLGNALTGVAAALAAVNGIPYLMGISPAKDRNKAFTLQSAIFALAAFLGSLLAGTLPGFLMRLFPGGMDEARAFNAVLWMTVPIYLVTGFVMRTARQEPELPIIMTENDNGRAPVATLLFLGILFGLQLSAENTINFFMNVYLAENLLQTAAVIGIVFAVSRLLPFFVSPLQPLALGRWGSGKTMTLFYLLIASGGLILSFVPTLAAAVLIYILFNIFISFTGTARNLFGQEAVQPQWRTTSSAVLSISTAVAGGLIGFSSGLIIDTAGFRGLFGIGTLLALLSVAIYSIWQRWQSRRIAAVITESIPKEEPAAR